MNVIETNGLGKSYGSTWALRDCNLAVPDGTLSLSWERMVPVSPRC